MRRLRLDRALRAHALTFEQMETRVLLAADLHGMDPLANESLDHLTESFEQRHEANDPLLRYDSFGNSYYFDPAPEVPTFHDEFDDNDPREVDIPPLHSKPESTRKIYLDFDGHVVVGTNWNEYNEGLPIHAPPYSTNANIWEFTQVEINNIIQAFNRVAEDFAPFDVDVTLEDPSIADPTIFTVGGRAIRALVSTDVDNVEMGGTGNQWFSGAGGVAYLNSWTWTSDTPVWIFENNLGNGNPKSVAEAASHEVGHSVNLSHDGLTGGTTYYGGHGSGETGWAPIMGVGYNRNVTQWSRGEYPNANQTQNDLNIITARIPYRTDDHSSVKTNAALATALTVDGTALSGSGIIERNTDIDVFRFEVSADSLLDLTVNPFFVGPNLDILAELFDSSGNLVAFHDPPNKLAPTIEVPLSAGVYTLAIDGVGNGTLATGYSDYASLGQFTIVGTLELVDPGLVGDFNQDGTVDATDIDMLCFEIVAGDHPLVYDLNNDGIVNQLDMDEMIREVLSTQYGDANLDGLVDGSDFGIWNANKFQPGGWGAASYNCDGVVDGSDFGIWNGHKFTGTLLQGTPPDSLAKTARAANQMVDSREEYAMRHAESTVVTTFASPVRLRDEPPSALRRIDMSSTRRHEDEASLERRLSQVDSIWAAGFVKSEPLA